MSRPFIENILTELDDDIEDPDGAEREAFLEAEKRRWQSDWPLDEDDEATGPSHPSDAPPLSPAIGATTRRRQAADDLPPLHELVGYMRDLGGRWRYQDGGALVPGARDVTLRRLWRFRRRAGNILVPAHLVDGPGSVEELAWCHYRTVGESVVPVRSTAVQRNDRQVTVQRALLIPRTDWDDRADVPLGLDAPELAPGRMLDTAGVAKAAGNLKPSTIRGYVSRGYLPRPVLVIGSTPMWSVPIVMGYLAARPGQGKRRPALKPTS